MFSCRPHSMKNSLIFQVDHVSGVWQWRRLDSSWRCGLTLRSPPAQSCISLGSSCHWVGRSRNSGPVSGQRSSSARTGSPESERITRSHTENHTFTHWDNHTFTHWESHVHTFTHWDNHTFTHWEPHVHTFTHWDNHTFTHWEPHVHTLRQSHVHTLRITRSHVHTLRQSHIHTLRTTRSHRLSLTPCVKLYVSNPWRTLIPTDSVNTWNHLTSTELWTESSLCQRSVSAGQSSDTTCWYFLFFIWNQSGGL